MEETSRQYDHVIEICSDIFRKKMYDYGLAWRILRTTSLTDQIYIKANRIRSLETKTEQKIDENARGEYIGIINYAIMALIQLELGFSQNVPANETEIQEHYNKYFNQAKELMMKKNHDYDEAWRLMRISSYTDLILMKIFRTKQIESHKGQTLISEGIDANYYDMINYSAFALIRIDFDK